MLLVMAIGYANNLLYFFVFFLISMALTGMWMTNKNVDLFQIEQLQAECFFAQEENKIGVLVANRKTQLPLWDIEVRVGPRSKDIEPYVVDEVQFEKKIYLSWKPEQRGYYRIPRLVIESRFPFRMLRAWKYYDEKAEFYIFPLRQGVKQIPKLGGSPSEQEAEVQQAHDEGLFRDFREYQKSDPPQRIDWKRSLKHQKHLVKNFETSSDHKVLLDWSMSQFAGSFEERISQMAFWIDHCHQKNEVYNLKIKDFETGYGSQMSHYKICMQKLAVLKEEDVA